MTGLKKIACKIYLLVADILLLGFNLIKTLNIPTRKRKGNLLSSLFIFFIGLIEKLNLFEHGVFSIALLFKKKYVRKIILVIGFLLFLLSLFEWTGDKKLCNSNQIANTERSSSNIVSGIKNNDPTHLSNTCGKLNTVKEQDEVVTKFLNSFTYSSHVKKFLLIRSLRI